MSKLQKSFFDLEHCFCLQCFDAVGCMAGRASGLEKNECWGASVVTCLGRGTDLHMAQLIPLPVTVPEIQIGLGFTFLVSAHLGSPGQNPESHKMVVVVVHGALLRIGLCVICTINYLVLVNRKGSNMDAIKLLHFSSNCHVAKFHPLYVTFAGVLLALQPMCILHAVFDVVLTSR